MLLNEEVPQTILANFPNIQNSLNSLYLTLLCACVRGAMAGPSTDLTQAGGDVGNTFSAAEIEFLAEDVRVTILPNFSMDPLQFIQVGRT